MSLNKKSKSCTEANTTKKMDYTGRDRFRSNLLYSWGGYMVVFVAGFISPRLIDRNLGQSELGIWDFSWSFVSYMQLAMLGIGSSINRYVAKYRAAGDNERLDRTVSTVVCLQAGIATCVLLLSFFCAWIISTYFTIKFGEHTADAQWTVILLGASLATNMAFDTSRGVLTGCHRWDLHTTIDASANVFVLVGLVTTLTLGGGLRSLGSIVLASSILFGLWRMHAARRVCPELHISPLLFRLNTAREMFRFGIKTIAIRSPMLILVQTTNIIIVSHLGPASLAVFARSIALVRHVEGFMSKFAFILAPTAGSLQGLNKEKELRDFFLKSTLHGVAFAMPLLFFLIVDGDLVLKLWMGDKYAHGSILAILALGYFLPTSQNSVREILKGMNAHGKIGLLSFLISGSFFLVGCIILAKINWTLKGAAIVLSTSLTTGLGFAPAVYACRRLHVPYLHYLYRSILPPLLCNIVFVTSLLAGRLLFPSHSISASLVGGATGLLLLTLLYLRFIFPEKGWALWKNFQRKFGFRN